MKPAPNTLVRESNLPGRKIKFGIGDPRWVMQTQAELYSDVTTAIIREYSTNAYDAHVMAGHRDPIEVTLPTLMNPFFIVKDHGVGMNADIFERVYTQFGISDKRDDNTTNGKLGYGSKSGVAYTTKFTVTSVRDGIKTEALVERMPDWSIVMTIVSEEFSDEHNGTTIKFVIHNVDEFNHKANEFYKFWLPGRVLINGKPNVHHVGEKIADNLYHSKDWYQSHVVMGNVAYRINNPEALFRNTKMSSLHFVAYVDDINMIDGAEPVEHTPSREDLKYTDRTKATLQAIISQFEKDIMAKAKAEIDAAKTHAEAYEAWSKWTDTLGRDMFNDLTFKGDKFQSDFLVRGKRYETRGYRNATMAVRNWGVETMPKTMIVTDFNIEVSSNTRLKSLEYANQMGWDKPSYVLFTPQSTFDANDSPWVDWTKAHMVSWADLKAALPKAARVPRTYTSGTGRVPGSWDYYTRLGKEYEKSVPANSEVFYIDTQQDKNLSPSVILQLLDSDAVVLVAGGNRIPKLVRENPNVKPFLAYAQSKIVHDGASLLSDEAKRALAVDYHDQRWANFLDVTLVDDPLFAEIRDLVKNKDTLTKAYNNNLMLANHCQMRYNGVKQYEPADKAVVMKKYPLLAYFGMRTDLNKQHLYLYLNAAYAAEMENNND